MRAERNRDEADGVLPPLSRLITAQEINIHEWFRVLRTIVGPQRKNRRRSPAPESDAAPLGNPVRYPHLSEIRGQ